MNTNQFINTTILSSLPLSAEIFTTCNNFDYGKQLAKFGVVSDLHLKDTTDDYYNPDDDNPGDGNGILDLYKALSAYKDENVDFVAVCGDIVRSDFNNYDSATLAIKAILNAIQPEFKLSCVNGNHDQQLTPEQWKNMTSCELGSSYIDDKYNRYIFMYMKKLPIQNNKPSTPANQLEPFDLSALDMLSNVLDTANGKTIHLFMHFPLNALRPTPQFAGLGELYYPGNLVNSIDKYGFDIINNTNDQNTRILNSLNNYDGTVIVYSGHTHCIQQTEQFLPNIMVSQASKNVWTVHVPSLNFPRDRSRNAIAKSSPILQPSQGYIVECYEHMVLLKCIEFNENCAPYPNYILKQYIIPIK